MLSRKYRIIHKYGMYRAQWSRVGILWTDIRVDSVHGAHDSSYWTHTSEQYARDAIAMYQTAVARRAAKWQPIPL